MLSPDEEFYNGIEVIYEQCENDGYSILEIVSLSGESLYLYPVRSINPKNVKVVFFANKIQAQWFKKLKKNLIKDHLSIEDFLRKYDLSAVVLSYELEDEIDEITPFVSGFGKLAIPKNCVQFFDNSIKFLRENPLITIPLNIKVERTLGLPAPFVDELLSFAAGLAPELLKDKTIIEYESKIDGKPQALTAVGQSPESKESDKTAYVVFPNSKAVQSFKSQTAWNPNGETIRIIIDVLLVEISKVGDKLHFKLNGCGDVGNYSRYEMIQLFKGFLAEIETLWEEENFK